MPDTRTHDSDVLTNVNVTDNLRFDEQSASPSTPAADQVSLYVKSGDKRPYVKDDDGLESPLVTDEASVTAALPVVDETSLAYKTGDDTANARLDVNAVSTATTRVITMPDANVTLADIATATQNADKRSKGIYIPNPSASESEEFFHTPVAITITRIYGETDAGTVTFKVTWNAEGGSFGAGTAVHATGLVADTTGEAQTSGFADATIPAGSVLKVVTSAVVSSPTEFIGLIEFTID